MLLPLALFALAFPSASDAGVTIVAPVTSAPGARAVPPPGTPVDISQLPFTPDSIAQVVKAHQPEIQDCYEKTLAARDEKLQGRLMTQFVITASGSVTGAQVAKRGTTLKDKDLNACVLGVLGKLRFPKPPDGKQHPVEYPFNLQPVE
jgi:outer membrane biosynthesis protein TonB